MEHFKIYTLLHASTPEEKKILLTNSHNLSSAATFDESFTLGKHDQSSLSFSIAEKLDNGERNPYLDYLLPESVIALDLIDRKPVHDTSQGWAEGLLIKYKIKGRQPTINKKNCIWEFLCEDYASTVYSKEALGLAIDKTGTLQEITEEILGISRKNMKYEDLNVNYATELTSYASGSGFESKPPYLIFSGTSLSGYDNGSSSKAFMSFKRPSKMVPHEEIRETGKFRPDYNLHFDLINSSYRKEFTELPLRMSLFVRQYNDAGLNLNTSPPVLVTDNVAGVPKIITIPFELDADTTRINLTIASDPAYAWPIEENVTYNISLANYKIIRNKDFLLDQDYTDPLHLNNLDNLIHFSNFDRLIGYQDTKMTFNVENSNLYNAITDLATLFEAEVKFDYEDNAFYYVSNKGTNFRGYRVHPQINLKSITRPETSSDFASILHLRGSDDVNSVIPALPIEWRDYFLRCVTNNFKGEQWFENYSIPSRIAAGSNTYTDIAEKYLIPNLSNKSTIYERKTEIMKFAQQMDNVPNFDGTLYDFSYFYNEGLMSEALYNQLLDKLYNQLRKTNITMNVKSYQYYTILSQYSGQQTQMAYYITGINTERIFQYRTSQKLDPVKNPSAPRPYTAAWISLKNQINASESQEQDFRDSLSILLGYTNTGLNFNEGSFLFNIFNLFGYDSAAKNGLTHLIEENRKAFDEKREEQKNIINIINKIQTNIHMNTYGSITIANLISQGVLPSNPSTIGLPSSGTIGVLTPIQKDAFIDYVADDRTRMTKFFSIVTPPATPTVFENQSLEIELTGYQSKLERIYTYLGFTEENANYNYPGTLVLEFELLNKLKTDLANQSFRQTDSLYDVLFNRESENNIVKQKEMLLQDLYTTYESFSIEGVYENSDEVDAYGLLDQGLKTFVYFSKPKIEYSVSVIEIGAIEGYKDLPLVEVGEKILIGDGLYKTYHHEEETQYLIVTEFSMSLRDPSSLSLKVTQDDETDRLVKALFTGLNLVKIQPYKQKSNLVVSIPREVSNLSNLNLYYSNDFSSWDDAISNNVSLFSGMFIKTPHSIETTYSQY